MVRMSDGIFLQDMEETRKEEKLHAVQLFGRTPFIVENWKANGSKAGDHLNNMEQVLCYDYMA